MSRKAKAKSREQRTLRLEQLESREMCAVDQLWFSGSTLVVKTNNAPTTVEVWQSGSNVQIRDVSTARSWNYAASSVGQVEFQGGAGNDRFVNMISNLKVKAFGFGGNDYLEGYNAADQLMGGDGNDTLVGYGGDDLMYGGNGHDTLRGGNGNDQLVGEAGNDHLNGQAGNDKMWGGLGNDVLIAIDSATGDYVQGDDGADAFWVDRNGSARDQIFGAAAADKIQDVASFANGADRTLNGDRISDPAALSGQSYKRFQGNPLFSSLGPRPEDIRQGATGDCYFLSAAGGVALDNPTSLQQNIVDFDDGTYGVRLGNSFYRVDDDLPVAFSGSTTPANAGLGTSNSMWVAIAEKAFAHHRTGANSYASIEYGWGDEGNRALGSATSGRKFFSTYGSATAMANDIFNRWNTYQAVTINFAGSDTGPRAGDPLVLGHAYTVMSVNRNSAGVVTSIVLRNPWGRDGAGSDANTEDGLVTVTPAQIFRYNGAVAWGRV